MSELEQAARPSIGAMVIGKGLNLSQKDQEIVATWTLKTCLVHTAMNPSNDQNDSMTLLYAEFFKTKAPSVLHRITIGAHCGPNIACGFQSQKVVLNSTVSHNFPEPVVGSMTTIAIGHFIGNVIYFPRPVHITPPPRLTLVWPFEKEFIWPTGFLDTTELESITIQ